VYRNGQGSFPRFTCSFKISVLNVKLLAASLPNVFYSTLMTLFPPRLMEKNEAVSWKVHFQIYVHRNFLFYFQPVSTLPHFSEVLLGYQEFCFM
jgi:hypothetical protein